jgi:hypothetical protein
MTKEMLEDTNGYFAKGYTTQRPKEKGKKNSNTLQNTTQRAKRSNTNLSKTRG